MPRKPLSALRTKMSAEAQARAKDRAREIIGNGLTLRELRDACEVTQVELAERAHTTQSEVSKIEQRTDWMVSTIRDYLRALGAELEVSARFADGSVVRVRLGGEQVGERAEPQQLTGAAR